MAEEWVDDGRWWVENKQGTVSKWIESGEKR
jgi:hypothetical protein